MILDMACAGVELAAADRLDPTLGLALPRPLLGEEIAAQCRVVADLRRRLAEEWASLVDLAERANAEGAPPGIESGAARAAASTAPARMSAPPEDAAERRPPAGRFADVTDEMVTDGAFRLAAIGEVSENTQRSYDSALRGVDDWLRERRPGRALTDTTLAEYLAVLMARGRGASSASQVVAAAKRRAKERGEKSPAGVRTAKMLRRYRRAAGTGRGQVRGISWEEADRMRDLAAAAGDRVGLRDAALVGVASDALLRVSEVSNIQVEDIAFEDDGSARLRLRRSKTDREGRGEILYLGAQTAERVCEWMAAAGIREGALFRRMRRGGAVAKQGIGPASVRRVIIRRAEAAGVDGRVSGHSLRVGSAQSLAKMGAGLVAMQKAGRWAAPDMPARYTRSQAAADGAVAMLRYPRRAAGPGEAA